MTGRERFLTALENKKPDRLPCQVHNWMPYYLDTYLKGMSDLEAYEFFGMDPVLYRNPDYIYSAKSLRLWDERVIDEGIDADGNHNYTRLVKTPEGELTSRISNNKYTTWLTEHPIKNERDFEIWNKYVPLPDRVDWTPVRRAKAQLGERGIVRGSFFDFGQGSPWQCFSGFLYDTQESIFLAIDSPDFLHHCLDSILEKKLKVIELAGKSEYDLVETGGGGGSSTVISPDMHREFCLPYDKKQHAAFRRAGTKTVYHLCGGLMPLLETVAENGCDALETMTPPAMGGDCDLKEAERRVGGQLCFIGGFDQNRGIEKGTPQQIESMVHELFDACKNGGYICCPSDHFFFGAPENVRLFADICKACIY